MLEEIAFFRIVKQKPYPQYQDWTQIHKSKLVYVLETSKQLIHDPS